ncbi:MAG TPA: MauE/DoxX family redox-associated membrane protein [Bacteroidia bacterium]|nr:MauE/DoxX family redox-associated membrane protein [Bacteroidia bacterium]
MLKKILLALLCILTGYVFIYSGYTKLYPIEPFEYTFVDIGIVNWQLAPFVARLLIGLEFLIGSLLILHLNLQKITYKLGISILLIFCVYLVLLMTFSGNKGNCGCFGTHIIMTPLQALIKNIIMLIVFIVLYKYHRGFELTQKRKYLLLLPLLASFSLPFILNPVALDYSKAYLNKPENNFKLELDSLYSNAKLTSPPRSLSQGKHIIAFMSLTCPHCRIAANKIRVIHERNQTIPFYFVLNGQEKNLKPFFENTHVEDMPYCMLLGKSFISLAGTSLPTIYLINNSVVEHDINYIDMDQKEIEKWLAE